ncbi:hypothetical protein ACLMJK_008696 [Lecanora helva]
MDVHVDTHNELVKKLTTGFGLMLDKLRELAQKNEDLEARLAKLHEEPHFIGHYCPNSQSSHCSSSKTSATSPISKPKREVIVSGSNLTGKQRSLAVADGINAWKVLVKEEMLPLQNPEEEEEVKSCSKDCREGAAADPGRGAIPEGHPHMESDGADKRGCPFAVIVNFDQSKPKSVTPVRRRPESLPTPPPASDTYSNTPVRTNTQKSSVSPPPSIPESASKCPIRLLDERSPEEIAAYFETHKHEIPRSHEVCVKRYQSNAESIRQLDAKYGSLVNMIQGLGMKHQPMLPAKENEEEFVEMDAKSAKKVENWAGNVKVAADTETMEAPKDFESSSVPDAEERQGHFDRPLKEIRVGESPSRPWGISVPGGIPPHQETEESEVVATPTVPSPTPAPQQKAKKSTSRSSEASSVEKPQMIFTGPVFIGYGAEQAAELIKSCGWDSYKAKRRAS